MALLEALVGRLEDHRDHPGTLEIHDAAYSLLCMLQDGADAHALDGAARALADAADRWEDHPLQSAFLGLVMDLPAPPRRTLEGLLASIPGLPIREDPLEALELHIRERRQVQQLLEDRIEELLARLGRVNRKLNLAAGVSVIIFALGVLGWLVAFGWLEMPDDTPPEVPEQEEPEAEQPEANRARRGRR